MISMHGHEWIIMIGYIYAIVHFLAVMARGTYTARTRRMRQRVARGAVLRQTSSDDETNPIVAEDITTSNVEEHNVSGVNGVAPQSAYPSTAVHGASSSKTISAIRGWTKDDMMKAINDVEFNGYSIRAAAK